MLAGFTEIVKTKPNECRTAKNYVSVQNGLFRLSASARRFMQSPQRVKIMTDGKSKIAISPNDSGYKLTSTGATATHGLIHRLITEFGESKFLYEQTEGEWHIFSKEAAHE